MASVTTPMKRESMQKEAMVMKTSQKITATIGDGLGLRHRFMAGTRCMRS